MNKDEWGKAVKIALIEKDMNQVDLADKLGLSRSYVSSIINGSVSSLGAASSISAELEVPMYE